MNAYREVQFELLRHGPPHNQLLSPLTEYLALCGNHSAASVRMPFEHNQFLIKLNSLMYKGDPETIQLQLKDTAQVMGAVLAEVPGLIAELAEGADSAPSLTHLRLILSASELAILPFEMANAPNGFPGAGQPLGLQAQAPICITREVRRVKRRQFDWPKKPQILFIASSPPGYEIPLEANTLALRKVIDPWIEDYDGGAQRKDILKPHLTVLLNASADQIQKCCARNRFSHIHILAHGVPLEGENEKRYGVALHAESGSDSEIIDGAHLATLLRTHRKGGTNEISEPAVVTLAMCQGAQQGSVVGAGASIAHALHEAGIPLVVASQFPLTFEASVLMTEILYDGLLWGEDPRTLLTDLRWQLSAKLPKSHDWAGLVAYASLPVDFDRQLIDMRIERAHQTMDAALKYMDKVTDAMLDKRPSQQESGAKLRERMTRADERTDLAFNRMKRILDSPTDLAPSQLSLINGLLASAEKRRAKISFGASQSSKVAAALPATDKKKHKDRVTPALKRARQYYAKAFDAARESWALVQELSLTLIIDGKDALDWDQWRVARRLSERDLYADSRKVRAWAHGNLAELYLLAILNSEVVAKKVAEEKALYHSEQVAFIAEGTFAVYSTWRQFGRYRDWYSVYDSPKQLGPLVEKILPKLTFDEQFRQ